MDAVDRETNHISKRRINTISHDPDPSHPDSSRNYQYK